ncbi:c-type cytochrome [Acuticoccus sp. 2012]|uniref:C-type cytochrome n=1 Tax=Acuticoccus mangrovi TaxID=2796142 RepID=A0A934IKM5_9HYPH|nr:c-type cytochrome [Acuticoccus mangrovi]
MVLGLAVAGAVGAAAVVAALTWVPLRRGAPVAAAEPGNPQRGAYLARTAGCIACHTDLAGGGKPLAGGPPLDTAFGTFRGPNLTTDADAGIGDWSLDDFATAVRRGVSPSGAPLYPVFPYTFYAGLTDQDVADLYAAFRTVAPVATSAPAHDIPFPFSWRPALKLWRLLNMPDPQVTGGGDGTGSDRGRYLVENVVHCGACHTPRGPLGGRIEARRLEGGDDLPGGGSAPPITAAALAADGWTEPALAASLQTGIGIDGDAFGGAMGEFVSDTTRFLTEDDRLAIAAYLLGDAAAAR